MSLITNIIRTSNAYKSCTLHIVTPITLREIKEAGLIVSGMSDGTCVIKYIHPKNPTLFDVVFGEYWKINDDKIYLTELHPIGTSSEVSIMTYIDEVFHLKFITESMMEEWINTTPEDCTEEHLNNLIDLAYHNYFAKGLII